MHSEANQVQSDEKKNAQQKNNGNNVNTKLNYVKYVEHEARKKALNQTYWWNGSQLKLEAKTYPTTNISGFLASTIIEIFRRIWNGLNQIKDGIQWCANISTDLYAIFFRIGFHVDEKFIYLNKYNFTCFVKKSYFR